ncbi:DUF4936 family protein [Massilia niastensis]|uniref:DUF4936 family protein n=1 Tax=Massilia niastensis TaxID=544911 RepID=UPI0003698B0B|nr:DUF4936 family protein [Massilia niastensis]
MVDLYVYYKVRDGDAARLAPLVREMQQRLADGEGVRAELKRRPGAKDGLQTWMEVYPAVGDGFAPILEQAAAGLLPYIEGPRRAEVFTDLIPCA